MHKQIDPFQQLHPSTAKFLVETVLMRKASVNVFGLCWTDFMRYLVTLLKYVHVCLQNAGRIYTKRGMKMSFQTIKSSIEYYNTIRGTRRAYLN